MRDRVNYSYFPELDGHRIDAVFQAFETTKYWAKMKLSTHYSCIHPLAFI